VILKKGFQNKNTYGQTIKKALIDPVYDVTVLNHCGIKCREEFIQKRLRGRADLALNLTQRAKNLKEAIEEDLNAGTVYRMTTLHGDCYVIEFRSIKCTTRLLNRYDLKIVALII
jgi:hypothetical protein